MVDHLRRCVAFADKRDYWCVRCGKEERLPRRADCLSRPKSILGSVKKLTTSIARSIHPKRAADEMESHPSRTSSLALSSVGPDQPPAEMFAEGGHDLIRVGGTGKPRLYTPEEADSPPVYEAASSERLAELPACLADPTRTEGGPVVPAPSRQGSDVLAYETGQPPTPFSVSPSSTMYSLSTSSRPSLVTVQTSWSGASKHSSQSSLTSEHNASAARITDQDMCDSPVDATDFQSHSGLWDTHATRETAKSSAMDVMVSPLEQSPVTQPGPTSKISGAQHTTPSFEEAWGGADSPRVTPPPWPAFQEYTFQPAVETWGGQSRQFIPPLKLQHGQPPEFSHEYSELYHAQLVADLDGTPMYPGMDLTTATSAVANSEEERGVPFPAAGAAATPLEVEGAPMLFDLHPPAPTPSPLPPPVPSPLRKHRRPRFKGSEDGPNVGVQCQECNETFQGNAVQRMLKRHVLKHRHTETVFVCGHVESDGTVCPRSYNREDNLVQHRRKKGHPRSGEQIKKSRQRRHKPRNGGASGDGDIPAPALPDLWMGITPRSRMAEAFALGSAEPAAGGRR